MRRWRRRERGPSVSHSQILLPTPGSQLVAYVVRLRGHMSKALLHRASRVCVSHPPPKREQTWRPVHYRLPVTHKIPQLKSVSKYAAGTAADAADAGRGVLHSTISLRHRVVVHTAIRLPFSARSAANVLSAFPLSLSFPCIPMSSTFWSDACTYSRNKPLPTRLEALYASCGTTVRRPTPSLV